MSVDTFCLGRGEECCVFESVRSWRIYLESWRVCLSNWLLGLSLLVILDLMCSWVRWVREL